MVAEVEEEMMVQALETIQEDQEDLVAVAVEQAQMVVEQTVEDQVILLQLVHLKEILVVHQHLHLHQVYVTVVAEAELEQLVELLRLLTEEALVEMEQPIQSQEVQ